MITGEFRASFANVFTPKPPMGGGDPKYSITMLIPKADARTLNEIFTEIERAKQKGASEKWGGKVPPGCKVPIYDGDGVKPSDGEPFGEECRGHFVLRASSIQKPGVVDLDVKPIINPGDFYSGCYAIADINFFPYDNGLNKGIGCGLNNVQKRRDGEPFSSRPTAEESFGGANAYAGAQGYPAYAPPAGNTPAGYGTIPQYGMPPQPYGAPAAPYGMPAAPPMPGGYGMQAPPPQAQYPAQALPQAPYPAAPVDPVTGYPMAGGIMGL